MNLLLYVLLSVFAAPLQGSATTTNKDRQDSSTPKEAGEGWVPLVHGKTTSGWKFDGEAKTADGVLVLGGGKPTTATLEVGYAELCWEHRVEGAHSPRWSCTATQKNKQVGSSDGEFSRVSAWEKKVWAVERWTTRVDPNPEVRVSSTVNCNFRMDTHGSSLVLERITGFPANCQVVVRVDVPKGSKLFLRNVKLKPSCLQAGPHP